MKRLFFVFSFFPLSIITIFISILAYSQVTKTKDLKMLLAAEARGVVHNQSPFFAYASIPDAANDIRTAIRTGDVRPVMIDLYLERFSSPMQGYGHFIFEMANKYNVDPYLFVAIAQQESNLGKKMPSDDCHNAWGYGIHSQGTLCFDTWEVGIETVMKGLKEKYLNKGLSDPDSIMAIYTPKSNGSWSYGVNQFMEELRTGNF
jgi:hypothetical protein